MKIRRVEYKKNNNGSTLIEVLVAMVIIMITASGGIVLFLNSSELKSMAVHKKMVVELANTEMEKFRAMTCADAQIAVGTNDDQWTDYSIGGLNLLASENKGKKVNITPKAGYCELELSIKWNEVGKINNDYDFKLITYVAP